MDFFGAQDRARRQTGRLVALFVLAVAGIVAVVYLAAAVALLGAEGLWDPGLLVVTTFVVGLVVGIASASRSASLRRGGGASVAEALGGRRVEPNTSSPDDRRLLNVVEEMAIAAGTPVPAVYVLEHESGINAFAAGYGPDDAVVAVTRGGLDRFTRDELQGVVAHEFSHIVNRDIRLNIQLTGLIFGILALGLAGRLLLRSTVHVRGGGKKNQGAAAVLVIGLALLVAGYVGVFVGRIIRAAVSRQREFLADAAAVQFTRNPGGLASALRKVRESGSRLESASAEEYSHFFFASGLRRGLAGLVLATHPPLDERIRRLEGLPPSASASASPGASADAAVPGAMGLAAGAAPLAVETPSVLPEALRNTAHDPFSAAALCYALMIAPGGDVRGRQRAMLTASVREALAAEVDRLLPAVEALPPAARLPLLDVAAPALRELSPAQASHLAETLDALAHADERLSLFEFALKTIVRYRLAAAHEAPGAEGHARLDSHRDDLYVLLSALALAGHDAPEAVQAAYWAGVRPLPGAPSRPVACTADDVQHALDRLSGLREADRARVLDRCMAVVTYDRHVVAGEAFLMQAIAAALRLPAPAALTR